MSRRLKNNKIIPASAPVVWDGTLPVGFRYKVAKILGIDALSALQWRTLRKVIKQYSDRLNRDHVAAPGVTRAKLLLAAKKTAEKLAGLLEELNKPEMGAALSTDLSDRWEEVWGEAALHDARLRQMETDLVTIFGDKKKASDVVTWWRDHGTVGRRPVQAEDFQRGVFTFRMIAWKQAKRDRLPSDDVPFRYLVGLLDDWSEVHQLGLSATKQNAAGNFGTLTHLVEAILEAVPVLTDGTGRILPAAKQIKPDCIAPDSLADAVIDARRAERARRRRQKSKALAALASGVGDFRPY